MACVQNLVYLIPALNDVVATQNNVRAPPQNSTSHNKILLLGLVAKKFPFSVGQGIMSKTSPASNCHILTFSIHGGVLEA
jgi:hypothetical protein